MNRPELEEGEIARMPETGSPRFLAESDGREVEKCLPKNGVFVIIELPARPTSLRVGDQLTTDERRIVQSMMQRTVRIGDLRGIKIQYCNAASAGAVREQVVVDADLSLALNSPAMPVGSRLRR